MVRKPVNNKERLILNEGGLAITEDRKIAHIFNNYFTFITKTLDIPSWRFPCANENDPVLNAILKYRSHPRIAAIKGSSTKFNFTNVSSDTVYKHILNQKKGNIDTPLNILKSNADIITPFLTKCINLSLNNSYFPSELKLADIISIHKQGDCNDKRNYGPISILPTIFKVFEKVIYEQNSKFFENKFSKFVDLEGAFQHSIH